MDSINKLKLYCDLFKGRTDTYAYRREKGDNSGYSPAYDFNRFKFNAHKNKGGTISSFEDKTPKPLTNEVIISHLKGNKVIGIYPLLEDNTSRFLAADFDEKSRIKDSTNFITTCQKYDIPAYLEKSRSGNGGHVRIFFENNIPAIYSRRLFLELIKESYGIENLQKGDSFDRIFPNQDYLSKKGFGNLIALPLQGESYKKGNSLFINPDTQEPFTDQREFLSGIKKLSNKKFNELYNTLIETQQNNLINENIGDSSNKILNILVKDKIYISKHGLTNNLYEFLNKELNIPNIEYIMKKRLGKSVYKIEKYFNCIQEDQQNLIIPKGFLSRLENFCTENNIKYEIKNTIKSQKSIKIPSNISLYTYQFECINKAYDKNCGVIVAPPGSGKTIMALDLVAKKGKKTLIIVNRQELFNQRIERIEKFLGIRKKEIGQIKGGKSKIGNIITVGMLQTIAKIEEDKVFSTFGTIIVDECHHIPAKTFRKGIGNFSAENIFGFTATPKRKNNDENLIFAYLGPIISEIKGKISDEQYNHEIIIKDTELYLPFDYKTDNAELLSKTISFDTNRNNLITNDILKEIKLGRKIIALTERKEHIDILNLILKSRCETICLTGNDGISTRKIKMQQIKNGEFQLLLTTGQLLGEGLDIPSLDCLFLIYPFSFEGKLIQYIGRLQRGDTENKIYDYKDNKIPYLEKMFKKRLSYYKKLQTEENYLLTMNGESRLF